MLEFSGIKIKIMQRAKQITQALESVGLRAKGGKLPSGEVTIYIEAPAFGWHYIKELKKSLREEVGRCVMMVTAKRDKVQIHIVL